MPDSIRVAIVGPGNCASSSIEGLSYYRCNDHTDVGLLFPTLCGYSVGDLEVAAAFDASRAKVGLPVREAIYQLPRRLHSRLTAHSSTAYPRRFASALHND